MENKRLENLKSRLLKNPKFRMAYFNQEVASEMGQRIFEARVECGWSQERLAKKIGTKQPGIARIERGAVVPTLPMLQRIASALKINLELPRFMRGDSTAYDTKVTLWDYLSGSEQTRVSTNSTKTSGNSIETVSQN
jgi:ribosome-binding protein aMBF1 (putative translation factor)